MADFTVLKRELKARLDPSKTVQEIKLDDTPYTLSRIKSGYMVTYFHPEVKEDFYICSIRSK